MLAKIAFAVFLFGCCSTGFANDAAIDTPKPALRTISSGDMFHWTIGLFVVLAIFFLCIWGLRKLNGIAFSNAEKMRIVGGLSLGMRERVILLQVGKKQLILGVTPGRIDTLHVLEGDDCLTDNSTNDKESKFSDIIAQVIKGRTNG